MNRFQARKRKCNQKLLIVQILIFLAFLAWSFYGTGTISKESSAQQIENLGQSVRKDMTLCYALEGFYPTSVSYLEEHYGLVYDRNKYVINYEYTGSNLMPDVLIIEK